MDQGVTEAVLVERCREGDREAQRELYALTADRVYRLLLRLTGRPEDAFDLAQDTYLKVFGSIGQFQGQSGVATWIYRIAVNEARQLQRCRRLAGDKLREIRHLREAEAAGADTASDEVSQVRDALARLPVVERALLVLRHFDGLSYAEMAEILDKPPGTIASALNRARRMLRDVLAEESPGPVKNPLPESI